MKEPIDERFAGHCVEGEDAVLADLRRAVRGSRTAWLIRGPNPPFVRQSYLSRVQSARFDRHVATEWKKKAKAKKGKATKKKAKRKPRKPRKPR